MSGTISESSANTEAELLAELLSYPLARVMVSCLGDSILLRRYALAEAKLAYKRMQNEKEGLAAIADDLGLHPQGPGPYKIHFSEYIRAAHSMHSPKWKLTNRDLQQGYLTVTEEELKRIMEEAAREKILKGLPLPVDEKICATLQEYLGPLKEQLDIIRARDKVDLGQGGGGGLSALHQEDALRGCQRHQPGPQCALCSGQLSLADQYDSRRGRISLQHQPGL